MRGEDSLCGYSPLKTPGTSTGGLITCMRAHRHTYMYIAKFTYEQYATINQSNAGRFDPRVFVNCLQV